jgi:hypothetical protein
VPPTLLVAADEVIVTRRLLQCMSQVLARSCRSGMSAQLPLSGVKRTRYTHRLAAIDPPDVMACSPGSTSLTTLNAMSISVRTAGF